MVSINELNKQLKVQRRLLGTIPADESRRRVMCIRKIRELDNQIKKAVNDIPRRSGPKGNY